MWCFCQRWCVEQILARDCCCKNGSSIAHYAFKVKSGRCLSISRVPGFKYLHAIEFTNDALVSHRSSVCLHAVVATGLTTANVDILGKRPFLPSKWSTPCSSGLRSTAGWSIQCRRHVTGRGNNQTDQPATRTFPCVPRADVPMTPTTRQTRSRGARCFHGRAISSSTRVARRCD